MGLFRRKKKADYDRGLLPSSDSFWNNFSESSTRQEEGGTKINIHETSPIMSKGSGSLPKPTVGIINDILLEEKIIQTSDKARSLIDGGKYQEALEFCEKIKLNYVSCSPYRVPIARLAAAQAYLKKKDD